MAELTYLLIPPRGLMEVFSTETGIDVQATLRARDGEGTFMSLVVEADTDYQFTIEWMLNKVGPINERAREAFAMLCGAHMIFTGPVVFYDVAPAKVGEVVATLSRKED